MTDSEHTDTRTSLGTTAFVVGLVIAFIAGFFVADLTGSEPSDPALALAQEVGLALPPEQEAAFHDGVVSAEERREAAARWEACAEQAGVTSFTLDLYDVGWEASWGTDDYNALHLCQIQHFEATEYVWTSQDSVDRSEFPPDSTPTTTASP
ncbi:MAG: hypothetical protein ABFR53_09690 [Actinomycetota bacterium]